MIDQQMIDEGYAEGKKSFKYYSDELNENFNWNKVHKAMIAVEWHWYFGKDKFNADNMGIPSLETIKNHAYALLKEAYDDMLTHSTGGFTAGWERGELFLSFTLEDFSIS